MEAKYVPFFHVGVLVRDIDQAAADFGNMLGASLRSRPRVPPRVRTLPHPQQTP